MMQYCVVLAILFMTMVVVGIGVYFAFIKDKSDQKFQEFKAITRDGTAVQKLVSFDVISIKTLSATEIDKLFTGLHGGELHGIDIRNLQRVPTRRSTSSMGCSTQRMWPHWGMMHFRGGGL
ncbi:uncharacterized protein LOC144140942 [Haemaphysalis longicornis]